MTKEHNSTKSFVEDTFCIVTQHLGYGHEFPITNLSGRLLNVIRAIRRKKLSILDYLVPKETEFYWAGDYWHSKEVDQATFFLQSSGIFAFINPEYVNGKIVLPESQFNEKMEGILERVLETKSPSQRRIQELNSSYSQVTEAYLKD